MGQGKDIFEAFFKKDLAKRLLLGMPCQAHAPRYVSSLQFEQVLLHGSLPALP